MSERNKRYRLLSWLIVVLLFSLCATLGAIQYRSIGEVSRAERDRLQKSLQSNLQQISEDFSAEIALACSVLSTDSPESDQTAREREYAARYEAWRASSRHAGLIRRFAVVVREGDSLFLRTFDAGKGEFQSADWPAEWSSLRERLATRVRGGPPGRSGGPGVRPPSELAIIDLPQFDRQERGGPDEHGHPRSETGWRIVELNLEYVRANLFPVLLQRYLGDGQKLDYHAEVTARDNPATMIYDSSPDHPSWATLQPDASIPLFDTPFGPMFGRGGPERVREARPPAPSAGSNRGRWLLSVRHRTGSLETLVEQTRRRSLAVTGAILLLMLVTVAALVQFSRRAQRLAELQMEFVAGVSHELRTPLSVIRTAAHNLEVRVISNPSQVQRYGALIERQSTELADIVERILLFSNARAGRVIGSREMMDVDQLVEQALAASAGTVEQSRCSVETRIEPGLPPILGDPTALRHAVLNLIDNAAKYGSAGGWIGVSAAKSEERNGEMIEIRVADHGPGIPAEEQGHIFDAFCRGRMAVEDQIRGTGLGLSLVQRILKAHGGTVAVKSEPGQGTEFIVRIPAAPVEEMDEFTDPVSRR